MTGPRFYVQRKDVETGWDAGVYETYEENAVQFARYLLTRPDVEASRVWRVWRSDIGDQVIWDSRENRAVRS